MDFHGESTSRSDYPQIMHTEGGVYTFVSQEQMMQCESAAKHAEYRVTRP